MLDAVTFSTWRSTIVNAICLVYLDTKISCVADAGLSAICPSTTSLVLWWKASILVFNHIMHDKLISDWPLSTIFKYMECQLDILHLFWNGILPLRVHVLFIQCKGFLHSLGTLNPKFIVCLKHLSLCFLIMAIIALYFFNMCGTHQLNPGLMHLCINT